MVKLDDVVNNQVTPDGVRPITAGNVISAEIREGLRQLLKRHDPEGYALYRKTKYPNGDEAGSTDETAKAATRILFDRARDLLVPYYLSSKPVESAEPEPSVADDGADEEEPADD